MGMAKYADITPFYEWLDWLEKETNTPYPEYQTMMFYEIRDKLDTLQEVVRCKDCRYCTPDEYIIGAYGYCSHFGCYASEPMVEADDFCSHGERKDNE